MSRIGKQPIDISGVTLEDRKGLIVVRGQKGELFAPMPFGFLLRKEENQVFVERVLGEEAATPALWGLTQRLLANAVEGVRKGFSKRLIIEGVGYRAEMKGNDLTLHLGFSHPVFVKAPEGIIFAVEKNTILVSGFDKYLVGQTAANIRVHRKPEPYKGKGIHYEGEHVRRKAGKKAAA